MSNPSHNDKMAVSGNAPADSKTERGDHFGILVRNVCFRYFRNITYFQAFRI